MDRMEDRPIGDKQASLKKRTRETAFDRKSVRDLFGHWGFLIEVGQGSIPCNKIFILDNTLSGIKILFNEFYVFLFLKK